MNEPQRFDFGDNTVATVYDNVFVPVLFEPWAARLIKEYGSWEGQRVLDLATGSGIFAQKVSGQVGSGGTVLGADNSSAMLAFAKKRCAGSTPEVKFIESAAQSLGISSDSIDVVVCQQGFQFFPDKDAAAKEAYRVLCAGGKVVISTWRPVTECQFFGSVCNALNMIGEPEISDMMRIPYDFMPDSQLTAHFESAGFVNIRLKRLEQDLVINGGIPHAIEVVYATPCRSKLVALSGERQAEFRKTLTELLRELSPDGIAMGRMVSNVLSGQKQT